MISLEYNFLFVHVTKCAGHSIQQVLLPYALAEINRESFADWRVISGTPGYPRLGKHSTLRDYQRYLEPELFAGMFKFGVVRNPWERLISFHFSPHWGPVEWNRDEFKYRINRVDDGAHHRKFGEMWFGIEGGASSPFDNVDYIMRFERLNEEFRIVCERIGIPYSPLPTYNKSKHAHYSTYYDEELVELVRAQFSDVVERFGYRFGSNRCG
jgi:hypothetical protein